MSFPGFNCTVNDVHPSIGRSINHHYPFLYMRKGSLSLLCGTSASGVIFDWGKDLVSIAEHLVPRLVPTF